MQDHHATDHVSEGSTSFHECSNGQHMRWCSDVHAARSFRNEANIALGWDDDDIERKRCAAKTQANTCSPRRRHEAHFRCSFTKDAAPAWRDKPSQVLERER